MKNSIYIVNIFVIRHLIFNNIWIKKRKKKEVKLLLNE